MIQEIYMKVSHDKYEFPIAFADSAKELSKILGVKADRDIKMKCRKSEGDFRLVRISVKKEVNKREKTSSTM